MYLRKEITTKQGYPADCWRLGTVKNVTEYQPGEWSIEGNLSVFKDALATGPHLDNIAWVFTDFTTAEIDGNTRAAIVSRFTRSIIVYGKETNLFVPFFLNEPIGFQDAVVVVE